MSRNDVPLALPVVATGTLAGLVASAQCLCWVTAFPAAMYAVRWAARIRGGRLSGSRALLVGLGTGTIVGVLAGSLGAAVFLSQMTPEALSESAKLMDEMMGESVELARGELVFGYAFLAFWSSVLLGAMGAVLGSATLPPPADQVPPAPPAEEPRYRFEPPPGWSPESPPEAVDDDQADTQREDALPDEQPSRESVPPEAFASAWTSNAAGGRPRRAAPQPPPETEDSREPELDATLPGGSPPPPPDAGERPTLNVRAPSRDEEEER